MAAAPLKSFVVQSGEERSSIWSSFCRRELREERARVVMVDWREAKEEESSVWREVEGAELVDSCTRKEEGKLFEGRAGILL